MGINLHNKEYSMNMGYGHFYLLRMNIAKLYDKDFAKLYESVCRAFFDDTRKKYIDELNQYIADHNLEEDDIVEFLFMSDGEGKISSKTCKKLYNIVKDYNDDYMYGYTYANNSFAYFKEMLYDCATKHRKLFWR